MMSEIAFISTKRRLTKPTKPPEPAKTFVVTLAIGTDPLGRPGAVRLRQLLKLALRGFGLRCLSAVEQPPLAPDAQTVPIGTLQEQG